MVNDPLLLITLAIIAATVAVVMILRHYELGVRTGKHSITVRPARVPKARNKPRAAARTRGP